MFDSANLYDVIRVFLVLIKIDASKFFFSRFVGAMEKQTFSFRYDTERKKANSQRANIKQNNETK